MNVFGRNLRRTGLPFVDIAGFRAEIDAQQQNFFAVLPIFLGIALLADLVQGFVGALVTFEFNDIDNIGEDHSQIDPAAAGQHAAAGIDAGRRHHQVKQRVKIRFVAFGVDVVGNRGENRGDGGKKGIKIFVFQVAGELSDLRIDLLVFFVYLSGKQMFKKRLFDFLIGIIEMISVVHNFAFCL